MVKKFKIIAPEIEIDKEVLEKRNKAMFKDDFDKGGILAKAFILTYMNEPVSVTELTTILNKQYHIENDRATVYRVLKRLVDKHLFFTATSGYVISIPDPERREIHNKIMEKYHKFIRTIPEQFRKRFHDINYFWVANGDGLNYIQWCCDILGFKYEEEK